MTDTTENPDRPRHHGRARKAARNCGATGALGALMCGLACCLPAILVALGSGAATTSMAGMGHAGGGSRGELGGLLGFLQHISPGLLAVSIVLIVGAFALRRPVAAAPALLAGIVVYLSVHAQSDPTVMYTGMAVGYSIWIGLYLWTRPGRQVPSPAEVSSCRGHQEAQ